MIFREMDMDGVFAIELERHEDERGFFARTYCADEFRDRGLNTCWVQCNLSRSERRGTLRGIHYQAFPEPDIKLIRVARGKIFAVVVDMRTGCRNFGQHVCRTLSESSSDSSGEMLYVPAGCGFGFQTLADATELSYQMSVRYRPALARGIRWDDPALGIRWPLPPTCMSERDANLPRLNHVASEHA